MGPDAVGVDSPPKKERTQRQSRPRSSGKGKVKAEHIEALTVQVFGLAAMLRNARHWSVQDVNIEVKPWSAQAAELCNEYIPDDMVEKVLGVNAAAAVVMGVGVMVIKRLEMDQQLAMKKRMQAVQANRPELLRQEGVGESPEPVKPEQSTVKGTGAAARNPGTIPGLMNQSPQFGT